MEKNFWVEVATLLILVGGFAKAIAEYRRASNWKMAEFASTHVSALHKDDELEFACFTLEYARARLLVPQRYQSILGDLKSIEHSSATVERAMERILSYDEVDKNPAILMYRNCLDRLVAHLASTSDMLDQRLIQIEHVTSLKYYVDRLISFKHATSKDPLQVFRPYMEEFGYWKRVFALKTKIDASIRK